MILWVISTSCCCAQYLFDSIRLHLHLFLASAVICSIINTILLPFISLQKSPEYHVLILYIVGIKFVGLNLLFVVNFKIQKTFGRRTITLTFKPLGVITFYKEQFVKFITEKFLKILITKSFIYRCPILHFKYNLFSIAENFVIQIF